MLSDVIAALATPPGRSAVAVVRVSGREALEVVGRLVPGLAGIPARTVTLTTLHDPTGTPLDSGLVTLFPAPHSYTGEDLIELSSHGGMLIPAQVLAALLAAGARLAAPGEFTRRAVLNGKLDLLQAEAVGDLIDATAAVQGRAALHQLEGGLSRRLSALRVALLDLLSLLAYEIDFPEEDDGPVPAARIEAGLGEVLAKLRHLLATAPAGERLRAGALLVLAGRPNAGKSSLFNALLGTTRALVTEIPGTTRDTIEAASEVVGWPVRLADTAGLRDADERLERMGIEVSRRYVAAADLVLLCVEAGREVTAEEEGLLRDRPSLLIRSKADLSPAAERKNDVGLPVSTITGEGLERLREEIARRLFSGSTDFGGHLEPILTRERHRLSLEKAADAVELARRQLGKDPLLVAHHVRNAVTALEELIGVVHPDDVLGKVFEKFCVGK